MQNGKVEKSLFSRKKKKAPLSRGAFIEKLLITFHLCLAIFCFDFDFFSFGRFDFCFCLCIGVCRNTGVCAVHCSARAVCCRSGCGDTVSCIAAGRTGHRTASGRIRNRSHGAGNCSIGWVARGRLIAGCRRFGFRSIRLRILCRCHANDAQQEERK